MWGEIIVSWLQLGDPDQIQYGIECADREPQWDLGAMYLLGPVLV